MLAGAKRGQARVGHGQHLTSAADEVEVPREEFQCQLAEQTLASQTLQIIQKRQLSHEEVKQPKTIGIKGVGKIEKHQVFSPSEQSSSILISSLTEPSPEVVADDEHLAKLPVKPHEEGRAGGIKTKQVQILYRPSAK